MNEDSPLTQDDVVRIYSEHERLERRVHDVLRICESAGLGSPAGMLDNPFDLSLDSFRVFDGAVSMVWKSYYRDGDDYDSGTLTMGLDVFVGSDAAIRAFALDAANTHRAELKEAARQTEARRQAEQRTWQRAEFLRLKAMLGE